MMYNVIDFGWKWPNTLFKMSGCDGDVWYWLRVLVLDGDIYFIGEIHCGLVVFTLFHSLALALAP